jgi:hypothetical protein
MDPKSHQPHRGASMLSAELKLAVESHAFAFDTGVLAEP